MAQRVSLIPDSAESYNQYLDVIRSLPACCLRETLLTGWDGKWRTRKHCESWTPLQRLGGISEPIGHTRVSPGGQDKGSVREQRTRRVVG